MTCKDSRSPDQKSLLRSVRSEKSIDSLFAVRSDVDVRTKKPQSEEGCTMLAAFKEKDKGCVVYSTPFVIFFFLSESIVM